MSTYKQLQRKNTVASSSVVPTYPALRPSRSLASRPTPTSEPDHPVSQAQLEHAARFGHSFARISLFPPEQKNSTGLPDPLKAGVENLSSMSMDDVNVHYNSSRPASVQALAYTQGTEIHVGPGQEKHLPHEAWHVVQQKQGRVEATMQLKGVAVNDDQALEKEADVMSATALDGKKMPNTRPGPNFMWASEIARTEPAYQQSWHMPVGVSPTVVQRKNGPLVVAHGSKFKKKAKERKTEEKVQQTLDQQIETWVRDYGHSLERHAGLTTEELDARNIPLATTFEADDDLIKAAKYLITTNESKLNHWYVDTEEERITLWIYRPDASRVRGRRKLSRPDFHKYMNPMPPHPGFEDVDETDLQYVIGVFDRNSWTGAPKGLVTCYPSETKPT